MANDRLKVFTKGFLKENPTFVLLLGMCPTLATTTSAINGLSMGLATLFVLMLSNVVISAIAPLVPDKVHIPVYIVVIATFVTILQFVIEDPTAFVQILIVHTYRQDKVAEDLVGHLPTHLGAHIERGAHLVEEEVAVVVGYVVDGHVGVEETHGVALTVGHRPAEDVEKMSMGKHRLAGIEIGESL